MHKEIDKKQMLIILFFIRLLSSFAFAVLFSSLSIYLVCNLKYNPVNASTLVGAFIAFNYFLPVIGGYIGDRLFTFKQLFVIGHLARGVGCFLLVYFTVHLPNLGLAFFLIGSLASSVSINMFITRLYPVEDIVGRKVAFYWNYAGMNIGFLIGYILSGAFGLSGNYHHLFLLAAVVSIITALIAQILLNKNSETNNKLLFAWKSQILRTLLILCLVGILAGTLQYANILHSFLSLLSGIVLFAILVLVLLPKYKAFRNRLLIFYMFMLISIMFWSVYLTVPTALLLFVQKNIVTTLGGIKIAPQWLENFDPLTIIIGSFLLTKLIPLVKDKCRFCTYSSTMFAFGLLCVAAGLVLVSHGAMITALHHKMSVIWVILFIFSLSLGELFIGPIGYSLIGELVPESLKGLFMGTWIMTLGISSFFASHLSNVAIVPIINDFFAKRTLFANTFAGIAVIFVIMSILLLALFPVFKQILDSASKRNSEV